MIEPIKTPPKIIKVNIASISFISFLFAEVAGIEPTSQLPDHIFQECLFLQEQHLFIKGSDWHYQKIRVIRSDSLCSLRLKGLIFNKFLQLFSRYRLALGFHFFVTN
jgi:hypothetical protein